MFYRFCFAFSQKVHKGNQFIEKNISSENKLFAKLFLKKFGENKKSCIFALANGNGAIAQLVEQRTENPCVPSSILGGTTFIKYPAVR